MAVKRLTRNVVHHEVEIARSDTAVMNRDSTRELMYLYRLYTSGIHVAIMACFHYDAIRVCVRYQLMRSLVMAALIVSAGTNEGRYYPLGQRTTVIGRQETCPIQIV